MLSVPTSMLAAMCAVAVVTLPVAAPAAAAERQPAGLASPAAPPPAYADIADLLLKSSLVIDAVVKRVERLKDAEAVGVAAGKARLYVQADVLALISGGAPLPTQIGYIVDVPLNAKGKPPSLRKVRMLLFARAVAGFANQVRLSAPDAQRPWSPAADALVRRIVTETIAPDAPPAITGIGNAFHVAGTLPGEGETQVFLTTSTGRPVSLNILRRPGEQPRWAVALSEIVDEAAAPPPRDTLLWYRLACGLPRALPDASVSGSDTAAAANAREDYAFVLAELGPCRAG